jgi:hypothetical protein
MEFEPYLQWRYHPQQQELTIYPANPLFSDFGERIHYECDYSIRIR